jgi:uridine phosphorylase
MKDWFDESDRSRLVISPGDYVRDRGLDESASIAEDLVVFQTGAAIPHIIKQYPVRQYPFTLPAFLSNPPLYALGDEHEVTLVEGGYGAPAAVCLLEVAIELGSRRLFVFGQGGGVAREVAVGDLVLPTEVVREEGTSFHYMAGGGNSRPDSGLLEKMREFLTRFEGLTVHEGKTVTTDAAFRQTVGKERRWRELGILAVEMELSALLAAARYHAIPAVGLLIISDKHDLEGETPWRWGGGDMRAKRLRAIDLLIEFAGSLR